MKATIVRRLRLATWAALVFSVLLAVHLLWLSAVASAGLPNTQTELARIEATTNPMEWKVAALSLTMSRADIVRIVCTGAAILAGLQAVLCIIGTLNLVWLPRLTKNETNCG